MIMRMLGCEFVLFCYKFKWHLVLLSSLSCCLCSWWRCSFIDNFIWILLDVQH